MDRRVMIDAASAVAMVQSQPDRSHRAARREAETTVGLALVLVGAMLLGPVGDPLASIERLPSSELGALTSGGGPHAGAGGAGGLRGTSDADLAGSAGGALPGLAAELADLAATRAMARALAIGDAAAAAREARALAGRADELSGEGRRELARSLRAAAEAASGEDPALAEALRLSGTALEAPSGSTNGDQLQPLAAELERRSEPGTAPGNAPREPDWRLRGRAEVAVASARESRELPSARSGGSARAMAGSSDRAATADGSQASAPLAARTSGTAQWRDGGPDVLGVPWEWRSSVRRYFTRASALP
jgi:hypothetical protein